MINRILIRIKVVQMLYSYLLTRSEFRVESAPEKNTRDSKYAYELYLDLLLLILELSGYNVSNTSRRHPLGSAGMHNLLASKMTKSLAADNDIRDLILKGTSSINDFDDAAARLYAVITGSAAYRDYKKIKDPQIKDDVNFWNVIINTVFAKDTVLLEAARRNKNFTTVGFEQGMKMLLATLNNYSDTKTSLVQARKSLDESLAKAYELYHALLLLPVEITRLQSERIETAKEKYVPTSADLNPNMRFVENQYVEAISHNADMEEYLKSRPVSWESDYFLIKDLLDAIVASDLYKEYMEAQVTDFATDCEFWRSVMKNIVLPSDALAEALESKSIYWNDDLSIMGTFVLKTMKQMAGSADGTVKLLPMYKDDDDARFGAELFIDAISNRELYRSYIDQFIDGNQWDPERLAFMDIVIMLLAIAELKGFPSIPIPVTLNEYIEIANCYSTPRSGQFINGILFSVINYLKNEGILLKN